MYHTIYHPTKLTLSNTILHNTVFENVTTVDYEAII